MKKTLTMAAAALLFGSIAFADSATDQIVADLQSKGFERIEIQNGLTQIKVEAIRGTQKVEVIYDRATGGIIKQEVETVRAGENTAPGVSIRERSRDFVDDRGDDDDDDDDDRGRGRGGDDDDDDDDNSSSGSHDDDDDHGGNDDDDDDSDDSDSDDDDSDDSDDSDDDDSDDDDDDGDDD